MLRLPFDDAILALISLIEANCSIFPEKPEIAKKKNKKNQENKRKICASVVKYTRVKQRAVENRKKWNFSIYFLQSSLLTRKLHDFQYEKQVQTTFNKMHLILKVIDG